MRWGSAFVALLVCLVVCLLVVAFRVRTVRMRAATHAVYQDTLHIEADRARFVRRVSFLRRREQLQAR